MDEFLTEEGLNLISVLLVLAAIAVTVLYYFAYEMEQDMREMLEADLDTDPVPEGFTPDANYVRQVLAELGLRNDLPVYRNMDGAAQADIVDLKRGTSDNVLRVAHGDPFSKNVIDVRMP